MAMNLQELNIEELFAADNNDPEVQYKMACCSFCFCEHVVFDAASSTARLCFSEFC